MSPYLPLVVLTKEFKTFIIITISQDIFNIGNEINQLEEFNIATDFMEETRDTSELNIAGIFSPFKFPQDLTGNMGARLKDTKVASVKETQLRMMRFRNKLRV